MLDLSIFEFAKDGFEAYVASLIIDWEIFLVKLCFFYSKVLLFLGSYISLDGNLICECRFYYDFFYIAFYSLGYFISYYFKIWSNLE
jgi:hypothetical protein